MVVSRCVCSLETDAQRCVWGLFWICPWCISIIVIALRSTRPLLTLAVFVVPTASERQEATRDKWPSSLVISQGSSIWGAGVGAQVCLQKENLSQGLNFQLKSQESHRTWMTAFSEFNSWSLCSHNWKLRKVLGVEPTAQGIQRCSSFNRPC